jgi:single-stranded DNA-binding protein
MMWLFASGELVKTPERRATKAGNDYATGLLRVDGDTLVSVTCFDTGLVEQLLTLSKGDPLSVSGRLQISVYDAKDGEHRCSLSVTVTRLMASPVRVADARPRARAKPGAGRFAPKVPTEAELDDEIPPF